MEKNKNIDEAAVWRRVNAASGQNTPAPEVVQGHTETGLPAAMQEGVRLYQCLDRLYRRSGKKVYLRLSQVQKQENQRLKSLYVLQTGKEPQTQKGTLPEVTLRQVLFWQEAHVETLKALSRQGRGSAAATLERLAAAAQERWEELLGQL